MDNIGIEFYLSDYVFIQLSNKQENNRLKLMKFVQK